MELRIDKGRSLAQRDWTVTKGPAGDQEVSINRSTVGTVDERSSPAGASLSWLSVERFQREIVRSTFMMSQGRQWLQIACLDPIFRMLQAQRVGISWDEMGSPKSRQLVRKRSLPRGHVPISVLGQNEKVFELWLQNAIWIGQYVYFRDASFLPTDEQLETFVEVELGLEPWGSSATEEEVSGMKVMFGRFRTRDPQAQLSADEVIQQFTLPFWIKGDRHWVAGQRSRPGVLADPNGSMIRHLITDSNAKRTRGWQLTIAEQLYVHIGTILAKIEADDPDYQSLPSYRALIDEYNARHPGAEVDCLHR